MSFCPLPVSSPAPPSPPHPKIGLDVLTCGGDGWESLILWLLPGHGSRQGLEEQEGRRELMGRQEKVPLTNEHSCLVLVSSTFTSTQRAIECTKIHTPNPKGLSRIPVALRSGGHAPQTTGCVTTSFPSYPSPPAKLMENRAGPPPSTFPVTRGRQTKPKGRSSSQHTTLPYLLEGKSDREKLLGFFLDSRLLDRPSTRSPRS